MACLVSSSVVLLHDVGAVRRPSCYFRNVTTPSCSYVVDVAQQTVLQAAPELCCDDRQEYIQNFGVMYYWTAATAEQPHVGLAFPSHKQTTPTWMTMQFSQHLTVRGKAPTSTSHW
eukprot:6473114-Amphidinium_carterae.1